MVEGKAGLDAPPARPPPSVPPATRAEPVVTAPIDIPPVQHSITLLQPSQAPAPAAAAASVDWSFPMCSPWGAQIRVHYTLILYPLLQIAAYGFIGGDSGITVGVCVSAVLILSVLVNQIATVIMTQRVNGTCTPIVLWPFGGHAYCGHHTRLVDQTWISLAGPLSHIPQFMFWLIVQICGTGGVVYLTLGRLVRPDQVFRNFTADVLIMQICLGLFNLFPIYPLGGGQVLANYLMGNGFTANSAARVLCFVGAPPAVCTAVFGIVAWTLRWPAAMVGTLGGVWMLYQVQTMWALTQVGKADSHPLLEPRTRQTNVGGVRQRPGLGPAAV